MAEIKLRADEARNMAEHVRKESATATDQMNSLRSHLMGLTDSFTGQSQMAFDEAFQQWKTGSDQMLEGLTGLGNFLTAAADTIEKTDQEIASQLRGA